MILNYPSLFQVRRFTTFELVRAKVLLPKPRTDCEKEVMELVDERLGETNAEHRAIVEVACGYGPG
jgi:hypothetical protein